MSALDQALNEVQPNNNDRLLRHNVAVRENFESIAVIKEAIKADALSEAMEAWCELSQDVQTDLYVAPSKGGIFTTKERHILKHNTTAYMRGEL